MSTSTVAMKPSLLVLPTEILTEITRCLNAESSRSALNSLSQTCSTLRRITAPTILQALWINNEYEELEALEKTWLSTPSSLALLQHTKQAKIGPLEWNLWSDNVEKLLARPSVVQNIFKFVESMSQLRTLCFYTHWELEPLVVELFEEQPFQLAQVNHLIIPVGCRFMLAACPATQILHVAGRLDDRQAPKGLPHKPQSQNHLYPPFIRHANRLSQLHTFLYDRDHEDPDLPIAVELKILAARLTTLSVPWHRPIQRLSRYYRVPGEDENMGIFREIEAMPNIIHLDMTENYFPGQWLASRSRYGISSCKCAIPSTPSHKLFSCGTTEMEKIEFYSRSSCPLQRHGAFQLNYGLAGEIPTSEMARRRARAFHQSRCRVLFSRTETGF